MYKAPIDTYLSNSKASVIFLNETYEARNDAEIELLEIAVANGKVTNLEPIIEEPIVEKKKR